MAILGINNRTENWKTAYEFAPFFRDGNACAKLARTLDESDSPTGNEVKIELFWKGMRDYVDKEWKGKEGVLKPKCVKAYRTEERFRNLRDKILKFKGNGPKNPLQVPNPWNYEPTKLDAETGQTPEEALFNNLRNTEIDVVLETPNRLFIGEAKGEAALGTNGDYVLVHQLVRQYVMATILLNVMRIKKGVVPFLVVEGDKLAGMLNTGQVQFMISQKWLKKENVLTWGDIRSLQP